MPRKRKIVAEETPEQPAGDKPSSAAWCLVDGRDLIIALALSVLALVLRLQLLNAGLWYTDAVIAAQNAEATYGTGILHYMHGVGYPGNVITITVLYGLFRLIAGVASAESATLFSSFFSASLTVGLVYLLVRKMSGSVFAGLSASLVLNVLPVYLSTSTFGMSHQLAVFFIVLSFYLALLASERRDIRIAAVAAASLGWASAVRLESLQMFPLMLVFYWRNNFPFSVSTQGGYLRFSMNRPKDALLKEFAYLLAPLMLLLLIPYAPMLRESGVKALVDAFEYNRWLGFWVPGLTQLVIDWVTISLTKLGWILALLGLFALFLRKEKQTFIAVLIWCLYFLVLANTATVEDRHTIPALTGIAVSVGFGLELLYARVHKAVGVALLLILLYSMFAAAYPILAYRSSFCGPKAFAYALRDVVYENSVVIVMDEAPHLQYYGKIDTIGHPLDGDMAKINQSMRELTGYLQNGTSVYLVSSAFVYDSPQGLAYDPNVGLYNTVERKAYSNLRFDPQSKSITDTASGVTVGLYGVWQTELFSNFMVVPVKAIPNEDWHKKSVMPGNYTELVFKVTKRA